MMYSVVIMAIPEQSRWSISIDKERWLCRRSLAREYNRHCEVSQHFSVPSRQRRTTENNQSQSSSNGRLAPGVYPEVTLYSGHRWFGKIDLLLINADVIRIEEIKSGKPKPEDEEQILVYAWLWWRDEARNPARTSASQLAIRYPD